MQVKDASARQAASPGAHISQLRYIWVFAILVGILVCTRTVEGIAYAFMSLRASKTLHNDNFLKVLRGTMAYFDTTPMGRILNRFSGENTSMVSR